jgi:Homing endonuclease associated repeat
MATTHPAPANGSSRTEVGRRLSRYLPMAHPGSPGRWDRESILVALRAWVAEVGAAPRRIEWSGERPDEAGGAQRRWMVEHPRWPSSSCVASHFGTWSAALEAAGLPARRLTFDSSVIQRVHDARRLAASGMSIRSIAEQLDVSASSVHNYLRARECPDCGGPVTNPNAGRCAACAVHRPTITRTWTRQAVRTAIREWAAEHGRPPSYRDWTPSRINPGLWEAESPRWPSAAVVCDLYAGRSDSWNHALRDAGGPVRFQRWSDASVRRALSEFWLRNGNPPRSSDMAAGDWRGPHPATLRRRYGGAADAWRILGPVP